MKKTIIWLEDNPMLVIEYRKLFEEKFTIEIWDGKYNPLKRDSADDKPARYENPGDKSLQHFRKSVEAKINNCDEVAGFIIDVRIPVPNLAVLAEGTDADTYFDDITTKGGMLTGILVADCYLRNKEKNSPIGNTFIKHPILLLSVAGQLDKEYPELPRDFQMIEKARLSDCRDSLLAWMNLLENSA